MTPPEATKVEELVSKSVETTGSTAGEIEVEFELADPVVPEAS